MSPAYSLTDIFSSLFRAYSMIKTIVGRGVLFYEDSLYCLHPTLFTNFVYLPPSLLSSTPTPIALSVVLFLWLNGRSHNNWCAILLNNIMDLHMSSLGALTPEGPWCIFYAIGHQFCWGLIHNVSFAGTVLWFDITHTNTHIHTQRHTAHSGASKLTHP